MSPEREKNIELHIIIEASNQEVNDTHVLLKEGSDDKYVNFLLEVKKKMKDELKYGIVVSETKSHGRRKSKTEIKQDKLGKAHSYWQALAVIDGMTQKPIQIYLDRDGNPFAFSIVDTVETGRKIKA